MLQLPVTELNRPVKTHRGPGQHPGGSRLGRWRRSPRGEPHIQQHRLGSRRDVSGGGPGLGVVAGGCVFAVRRTGHTPPLSSRGWVLGVEAAPSAALPAPASAGVPVERGFSRLTPSGLWIFLVIIIILSVRTRGCQSSERNTDVRAAIGWLSPTHARPGAGSEPQPRYPGTWP